MYEARAPDLITNDAERLAEVQVKMQSPVWSIIHDSPRPHQMSIMLGHLLAVMHRSAGSGWLAPTERNFDVSYDYASVDSLTCSRSCDTSDLIYAPFPLGQVGSAVSVDTVPAEQQDHNYEKYV